MTPCRRVRNDQLATLKQHGGRRRRPSGLWSICVSGDRCGDAVGFSLSKGGNATDAGKWKGIGRKSRGNSCQRKHPAEILALGPSCASHRRSLNANSLGGRTSAGSLEICATLQWIICASVSEFESYMPSHAVGLSAAVSLGGWRVFAPPDRWSKAKSPGIASPADREIRASRQSQDRESARPRNTANIARCRGRSD